MASLFDAFLGYLDDPALLPALLAIAVAGLVRGFTGFGGAMVFMPFAAFLFDPALAVVAFFIIDALVPAPLVWNATKVCDWRTVLPCVLGSWCGVWLGAYLLATTDPLILRWAICGIIIALVLLMMSGWRYTNRPIVPLSLAVGASSGVLGGISQVSAPPVVAYWVSGPAPSAVIRANVICFFLFAAMGSVVAFLANGVFNTRSISLALWLAPFYGLAIFTGARLFSGADDRLFRKVAFAMILLAAITSLPLLDPILRS